MNDQWVVGRPSLCLEQAPDGGRIQGIDAEPVHRLGGKGDELPGAKTLGSGPNRRRFGFHRVHADDLSHPPNMSYGGCEPKRAERSELPSSERALTWGVSAWRECPDGRFDSRGSTRRRVLQQSGGSARGPWPS